MAIATDTRRMGLEPNGNRPVTELLRELRDEMVRLVQQEIALAKTEIAEKTGRFAKNSGYVAAGAIVTFFGLGALVAAACTGLSAAFQAGGLSAFIASWLAPLTIGLVLAIPGSLLALKALKAMKQERPIPEKTVESIKENKRWLQQKLG